MLLCHFKFSFKKDKLNFRFIGTLMHSGNNIRRLYNMAFLSLESLALKWSSFFLGSGVVVFHEYLALYMQQLGLSLAQISWMSLMVVQESIDSSRSPWKSSLNTISKSYFGSTCIWVETTIREKKRLFKWSKRHVE